MTKYLLILLLSWPFLIQAQTPCEDAAQIIRLAERDLANRTYKRAINRLLDARDNCPAKKEQINALIKKAFQQIEGEKQIALVAKMEADEQRLAAQQAQQQAQQARQSADSSLTVANQVLGQLYFYEDKFALTLKDVKERSFDPPKYRYGYINRQGEEVIPFEYTEATPFSVVDGFARVQKGNQKYLLDTTGVIYRLAESLVELEKRTEALDLHENLPEALPDSIGNYTALKVILCYGGSGVAKRGSIQSLPSSFHLLTKLRHLDLSYNQLTNLPESFGQLNQLQTLGLSKNQLSSLPEVITQLSQLKKLNLSKNQLFSLPEVITQLSQLKSLDLSENKLHSLPKVFGQLNQLQYLSLCRNHLSSVPKSFGQLSQLQSLDLRSNPLSSLPEVITQLSQLQSLDLSYNGLGSLPESFGQLSLLQTLDLSDNELSSLPESFGQLSLLQSLNLSVNELSSLPESFGQLSQLHTLDLSDNQLSSLSEVIQLSQLQTLGLRYNQLSSLPESFAQLSLLQTLDLRDNQLSSLPESFTQLSLLQTLELSDNQLNSLPESFAQLQSLYLYGNKLRSLPEAICELEHLVVREVSYPYRFTIEANPLTQLPDCFLDKHSEKELVEFADLCLSDSLYHVAWQTLDHLQRRFPERFAKEMKQFVELVAKLEGVEDEDMERMRELLEE